MGSTDLPFLDALVGEWRMTTSLTPDAATAPAARTTFEWLAGRQFMIQRWSVDHPAAPDGIAIIGHDASRGGLVQHYFDSRGVARVYDMTFADGVWTLERSADPPDFSQRFEGRLSADGASISGAWASAEPGGPWRHDFDLVYSRTA